MNIGEAARAAGVSARMLRHYEATGLLPRAKRSHAGYRVYDAADVRRLRFIRRSREAGFSTGQIKTLLSLWDDHRRPASEVKRLAQAHLRDLETRIATLQALSTTLAELVDRCHGGDRPDCPILESLAGQTAGDTGYA